MDRSEQRRIARGTTSAGCTATYVAPVFSVLPTGRVVNKCDIANASPIAEPFVGLSACVAPAPAVITIPDALVLNSDYSLAYCPTGPSYSLTGTTASAAVTGAQIQSIYFQDIAGITDNQLDYISGIVASSSGTIISYALAGNTGALKTLTKLNGVQSTELSTTVIAAKAVIDQLAVEQARAGLACIAQNTTQGATCNGTGAYVGSTASLPTGVYVFSATAAAGSVLVPFSLTGAGSTASQSAFTAMNIAGLTAASAEANSIAYTNAINSLRCIYGNAGVTATCCTGSAPDCLYSTTSNLGYAYTVPTIYDAIGTYYQAQNTIFSSVSVAEADAVASSIALSTLNCIYYSATASADCNILNSTTGGAFVTYTNVVVDAGSFIVLPNTDIDDTPVNSSIRVASSNAPGLTAGQVFYVYSTSASGAYTNITVSGTSGGTQLPIAAGTGTIYIAAPVTGPASDVDSGLPGSSVILSSGYVVLSGITDSTTGATEQAQSLALGLLDCYWENKDRTATCPTAAAFTDISGTSQVGFPASITASPNYTATVSAASIISYASQQDANNLAEEQADSQLQCYYCNARIEPLCAVGVTAGTSLPLPKSYYVPYSSSINMTAGLPGDYICDPNAAAAQNTALSISGIPLKDLQTADATCCYSSKPVTTQFNCGDGFDPVMSISYFTLPAGIVTVCITDGLFTINSEVSIPTPILGESNTLDELLAENYHLMSDPQVLADTAAQALVDSLLQCFYVNDQQVGEACASGLETISLGAVEAGMIISNVSKENANDLAKSLADSLTVCIDPELFQQEVNFTASTSFTFKKITVCAPDGSVSEIYAPQANALLYGESVNLHMSASADSFDFAVQPP